MDKLIRSLFKKKISDNKLDNLYIIPKKDDKNQTFQYRIYYPMFWHEADILYLPNDKGYKYALVVVDINTRLVDAVPLQKRDSFTVMNAFKQIYEKNSILKIPKFITTDNGSEFMGDVKKYLNNLKIKQKLIIAGRHRMIAIVERRNQIIGSAIHKLQKIIEEKTGNTTSIWVKYFKNIIVALNEYEKSKPKIKENNNLEPFIDHELLNVGDKVRIILHEPKDLNENKLHGKFRSSDIRWNTKIEIIEHVLITPNKPVLYVINKVAYTRNQLQVVPKKEIIDDYGINISNEKNRYEVEKILDKKIENKIVYYLIKWRGYKERTWEKRNKLIKDIPDIIKRYENR